jgi:hypothetical protein
MTAPWFAGERLTGAFLEKAPEPGDADPLQLAETVLYPEPERPPHGLGAGERALLYLALFFGTLGVALLASTLQLPAGFFLGMGWMVVLGEISQWERDRRRPTPLDPQPPEGWTFHHVETVGVPALVCRYGCVNPTTCRYPHIDCSHCRSARAAASVTASGLADGR